MKATFIFYNVLENKNAFSIPLSILSSCLKKAGHEVSLAIVNSQEKITKESFLSRLSPSDIFGFSALTGAFPEIKKLVLWIKEKYPKSLIVIGGSHALLDPEEVISSPGVDAVCIGEGEHCLVELANKIDRKKDIYDTKNFWFKKNGKIIKNQRLPLIEDLDTIPFLDRNLFDYYSLTDYKDGKQMVVMASRGCPYNCGYCANHLIRNLYPNKEKWLRFRKVDNVIKEIKGILEKFGPHERVKFVDDTLVQNKKWFEELIKKYPKEIGLPVDCQVRPNELDLDTLEKLKKLGVDRLEMGIESGNEFIRYKIMNRHITNEQIINAYHIARQNKIPAISFNIIGLPFENFDMILDTVKINALARPSWAKVLYFQPFPHTELLNICEKFGFIKEYKILPTLFEGSPLESPYVSKVQLDFIYSNFRPLIKLYQIRVLWPLLDIIFSSKLFPYKFFIKISPLINLKEVLGAKFPREIKSIKKLILRRK
ncbi:Radical SAM superfamily protein [uncultured archaeon]|nr:Radical SAM superfamily protein [uncultured archaeon]